MLKARPFPLLEDVNSTEAAQAGAELHEWGVTAVSHLPFRGTDFSRTMEFCYRLFEEWNEILRQCPRTHHGMRGPTATGRETQEGEQEPENKDYYSFQMEGGFPETLRASTDRLLRVSMLLHRSNVAAASAAARFYGRDVQELREALSAHGVFSAGRINRYQAKTGFSKMHLDTSAVAGLVFQKPFQIRRNGVLFDVEVEGPGPLIVHNFGKSLSLWLCGNRSSAVEHGVPKASWTKVSLVWFTNFTPDAVWPQDADPQEADNPVRKGGSVERWCLREFGFRSALEDVPAGTQS